MKRKLLISSVVLLMMVLPVIMLTGCFARSASDEEHAALHGHWVLTQTRVSDGFGGLETVPRNRWPREGFFIEFDADGTFREIDFWNYVELELWANTGLSHGTWALRTNGRLRLTREGGVGALFFSFVRDREVNVVGDTMTMRYTRPVPGMRNAVYEYLHTFTRQAD